MKKFFALSVLLIILFQAIASTDTDPGFKLVESKNGISLYERWVNYNGNKVREIKTSFVVNNASAINVIELLKNKTDAYKWNKQAKQYKIAYTKNDNVWLTYVRYNIPWPLTDQDCCLKYYYDKSKMHSGAVAVMFESATHAMFPEKKDVTRISGTRGSWVMESRNNQLMITYRIITNKSSSVPRWVSDPLIHDNIFTSMKNFKNLLETTNN